MVSVPVIEENGYVSSIIFGFSIVISWFAVYIFAVIYVCSFVYETERLLNITVCENNFFSRYFCHFLFVLWVHCGMYWTKNANRLVCMCLIKFWKI